VLSVLRIILDVCFGVRRDGKLDRDQLGALAGVVR
jgi:hypothetical protein